MPAKSTEERLILEFGAHVEYVNLEILEERKHFYRISVVTVPCCNSGPDDIRVNDEIIRKLQDQYLPGFWMWNSL